MTFGFTLTSEAVLKVDAQVPLRVRRAQGRARPPPMALL